jgi:hypothetical protein
MLKFCQAPLDYTSISLMGSERETAEAKLQEKAESAERAHARKRI